MANKTRLYDILSNRTIVNLLKILHEREYVIKSGHTLELYKAQALMGKQIRIEDVLNTEKAKLLSAEKVEGNFILSLTKKGKEFIRILDEMKELIEKEKKTETKKIFKVEYNLTELEKRILVICSKMETEMGTGPSLEGITQEMYRADPEKRKGIVSKHLNSLTKLRLLTKENQSGQHRFNTTETGKRTIKEQLMESII